MPTEASAAGSRLGFSIGGDSSINFELDEALYPLEAVYGACHLFLDRCYIHLTRAGEHAVGVRLSALDAVGPAELDDLAGGFLNELLSQALRLQLARSTSRIREFYTAASMRAATSAPSVDDLLAELESDDLLEDPLEIMVPWEEKHAGGDSDDGKHGSE